MIFIYVAKLKKITDEQLVELVRKSSSYRQICISIGITGGSGFQSLVDRISSLGVDTSHFTGRGWAKGKTKETHSSLKKAAETYSKNWKGRKPFRHLSIEHREAISRGCNERSQTNGLIKTRWFNVFNPTLNEEVKVQGTWEKEYAEYLNRELVTWIRNRKTSFAWTKGTDDIKHVYYPDFYLPESDTYVEIKGFMWKSKDGRVDDERKLKLVQEQNPGLKLKVLMKKDLLELGIKI